MMSYIVGLTALSGNLIWVLSATMRDFSSVQRVKEYIEYDLHERDWDTPAPKKKSWPQTGKIVGHNIKLRYREGLPLVLRGLNFEIQTNQKVGIVGRTGSGKSTLIKIFWKYLEPIEGDVFIDETNLKTVDLKALRSQITVITQETSLFEGTLKENLDPHGDKFSDKELTKVLENLKFEHAQFKENGLQMKIES